MLQEVSERLDELDDVLPAVPPELRRRLANAYATIQAADSVARMAVHQVGVYAATARTPCWPQRTWKLIPRQEDAFNTQVALLNKINAAGVLELRISETTNQFLMHSLEQLLLQNKRARDAEAGLMDAHQWRYGATYGDAMFPRSARALDEWRQP